MAIMPWKVENRGGSRPFKIVKTTTGEIVGSSTSREEAEASVRARHANEKKSFKKR